MKLSDQTIAAGAAPALLLDPAFAAMLCCPVCAERPRLREQNATLICARCGRVFPIINGLPDLRPESGVLPQVSETPAGPTA